MKIQEIYSNNQFIELVNSISIMWESNFDFKLKRKINGNSRPSVENVIKSIKEARELYLWPYSVKSEQLTSKTLEKGTSFEESMEVLSISKDLIISNSKLKDEESIKRGTRIVFQWGGVYKSGNRVKANDKTYSLAKDYEEVISYWNFIREGKEFNVDDKFQFESNAGFTKVYSLILEDFIIYDSRVSVALAYLIEKILGNDIPDYLKLFIPPSYGNGEAKDRRIVNPIFKPTNSNKKRQFYSNVISNLLLKSVLDNIRLKQKDITLRDIEAALFMIGYDIRN